MMDERTHLDYLDDILDAIEKIKEFTQGMSEEEFCHDVKTAYAVTHAFEIIGEATKRLPGKIKAAHPDLPWRAMAGMRDKLIHDYFGINLLVVWKTVSEDLSFWSRLFAAFWPIRMLIVSHVLSISHRRCNFAPNETMNWTVRPRVFAEIGPENRTQCRFRAASMATVRLERGPIDGFRRA